MDDPTVVLEISEEGALDIKHTKAVADTRSPLERLEAAAVEDHQNVAILREMVWLIDAQPDLPGFAQVCRHLLAIALLVSALPNAAINELKRWLPLLRWIVSDPAELVKRIFPDNTTGCKRNRKKFLETKTPNPILRSDSTKRCTMYSALWPSQPDQDLETPFRLLQSRVLSAHIAVMRFEVGFEDWRCRQEPYEGFYSSIYTPTWALRHFSQPEGIWKTALKRIDFNATQAEMPEMLRSLASEIVADWELRKDDNRVWQSSDQEEKSAANETKPAKRLEVRTLRTIAGFIEWGLDPENHDRRTGHGGSGNPNGGSRFVDGAGDDLEGSENANDRSGNGDDVSLPTADAQGGDRDSITVHLPTRWRRSSKGYKESIAAGDHPGEDHSSQPLQLADDEVSAAMAAGGAVEMVNQVLPWAYGNLATAEVAHLLTGLEESDDEQ
jgi:hypothetical protein